MFSKGRLCFVRFFRVLAANGSATAWCCPEVCGAVGQSGRLSHGPEDRQERLALVNVILRICAGCSLVFSRQRIEESSVHLHFRLQDKVSVACQA